MASVITGPGLTGPRATQQRAKYASFVDRVAAATGIDPRVLTAWATIENGPPDNPLNIMGQTQHHTSYVEHFGTPTAAADATIRTLRTNSAYAPVLRAAARSDVNGQLHAIAISPWDENHYRGDSSTVGALLTGVYAGLFGPAPGRGVPGAVSDATGALGGALGGTVGGVAAARASRAALPGPSNVIPF